MLLCHQRYSPQFGISILYASSMCEDVTVDVCVMCVQANQIGQHGDIVQAVSGEINAKYASLQQQHQEFVNHLNNQISQLEQQLRAQKELLQQQKLKDQQQVIRQQQQQQQGTRSRSSVNSSSNSKVRAAGHPAAATARYAHCVRCVVKVNCLTFVECLR